MSSIRPEYFKKKEIIDGVLKDLDLPSGISYKFEVDPHFIEISNAKLPKGTHADHSMTPPNVVGFYDDGKIIGRIYFVKEPAEIESLDGTFVEIEKTLKNKLNV
jgi:hypothetical protein